MTKSIEEMFSDPQYESVSCPLNCGFVVFWRMGEDGNLAVARLRLHKARGCDSDQQQLFKEMGE